MGTYLAARPTRRQHFVLPYKYSYNEGVPTSRLVVSSEADLDGTDHVRPASPPTARVIQILGLLSADPMRPIRLSEIAASLELNKATCSAVLAELTRAGWVERDDNTKAFALGRALATLGQAAQVANPLVRRARQALRAVTADASVSGGRLVARDGLNLVAIDRVADGSQQADPAATLPLAPPVGVGFLAWSPPSEIDEWFARSDGPMTVADRRWFIRLFAHVRATGYVVTRLDDSTNQVKALLARIAEDPLGRAAGPALHRVSRQLLRDAHVIDADEEHQLLVSAVTIPIFGADGRPVLVMSVHPAHREVSSTAVLALGERLVEVGRAVTLDGGGRLPAEYPGTDR
jgi:DNA-binding IclR family transcriptional regulator